MTLAIQMMEIGHNAREAARVIRDLGADHRTAALRAMAQHIISAEIAILAANAADIENARAASLEESFVDRLTLTPERIAAISAGIETVAALPDPVADVIADWRRPNGLHIQRVRTPLGVIGMIFESRPNVAADASALALRAGNAIILRGGSDSARSVDAIGAAIRSALVETGLPAATVQIVPSTDRAAVSMVLTGLDGAIDVLIPRGGKSLIARVQAEARVPVLAHLEGVCHTYVHEAADPAKAVEITLNAKMRRVSVCGATETLLIDRAAASTLLPSIAAALTQSGCALRGDAEARAIFNMEAANEQDWRAEYLAPILAVRVVGNLDDAVAHIAKYGSQHTESIVTEDKDVAEAFLQRVDSAIVLHNASTQFADGGEFGFGGEIGIATGRLHARGPVGAEQLTTYKYIVRGNGQIRP